MQDWDLDSAQYRPSQFEMQAPAEEIACVICANPQADGQPRTVCVVDVNPISRTYSEVIGEIALEQLDERLSALSSPEATRPRKGHTNVATEPDDRRKSAPRVLLAHEHEHPYGFSCSGLSLHDLSSAISIWYREGDLAESRLWVLRKVIEIPAEPARADQLPPMLRSISAVPPLITDIALSLDDRFLYVACWGTGCLKQFDVSDPLFPREVASISVGGIASRAGHPSRAGAIGGGPGGITLSRDGRRVYLTNARSPLWEAQVYPDGFQGWLVKLDVDPCGGLAFDPNFFVDFGDQRPQQVLLQGQGLE